MQIYTSCFLKNYEAINLCGKAVYMRQIAKLSLLRQIGGSLQSCPTYITHVWQIGMVWHISRSKMIPPEHVINILHSAIV